MAIGIDTFDLSMTSPDTGRYLTANFYTVDGVTNADGSLRQLSIGQLVMAICLNRASKLETDIIALMEEMNSTSAQLADMTKVEQAVVDDFSSNTSGHAFDLSGVTVSTGNGMELMRSLGIFDSTQRYVRNDSVLSNLDMLYTDFVTALESKMDEKNSFSQQTMIKLQSLTNKRDQAYDLISNALKSINTVLTGTVNNM